MGIACSRVVVCAFCATPCTHRDDKFHIRVYGEDDMDGLICCQDCLPNLLLVKDGFIPSRKKRKQT